MTHLRTMDTPVSHRDCSSDSVPVDPLARDGSHRERLAQHPNRGQMASQQPSDSRARKSGPSNSDGPSSFVALMMDLRKSPSLGSSCPHPSRRDRVLMFSTRSKDLTLKRPREISGILGHRSVGRLTVVPLPEGDFAHVGPSFTRPQFLPGRPRRAVRPLISVSQPHLSLQPDFSGSSAMALRDSEPDQPHHANPRPVKPTASSTRRLEAAIAVKVLTASLILGGFFTSDRSVRDIGDHTKALSRSADAITDHHPDATAGALSQIRRAIEKRAAVEIADSFHGGMKAWGGAPNALPRGWSRSRDGYMRPGHLALFRPSLVDSDYTFEFLGQIEAKSIDWVLRARDVNNYYAVKLAIVDPGLRPCVAIEHYAVISGKKGRVSRVPLNIMVHNDTAYRVVVSVTGQDIVTFIDGQQVDSWADERLTTGAVGFFSEGCERARLYWMKLSKNQDFLGRFCAYISGTLIDPSHKTAALRLPPALFLPPTTSRSGNTLASPAIGSRTVPNIRFVTQGGF